MKKGYKLLIFLIKSIQTNVGTDGTQTIQLMRYYPYYNF